MNMSLLCVSKSLSNIHTPLLICLTKYNINEPIAIEIESFHKQLLTVFGNFFHDGNYVHVHVIMLMMVGKLASCHHYKLH